MEQSKPSERANSGFSISSIMGFHGKDVEKCNKESEYHQDSIENVKAKPKSTISSLKSEKVKKKVKRLSNGDQDSKRYRATFDKAQIFHMERMFLINHYPDVASRSELSKATGLSESQVQIWFQNRRAKWRKQQRKRRQDIPQIFGLGYPTHLARLYPGLDPYAMFPYEYYNTDFWTCAQQQIAAMHYSGLGGPSLGSCILTPPRTGGESQSPPISSPVSSPSSPTSSSVSSGMETSPLSKTEKEALEIRNDSSLSSLRMKAKEHMAAMETNASS